MSDWNDDVLRHKYDPLPEEPPRHRKKAKRKHVRSDHKHEYETVCIDSHSYVVSREGRFPYYYIGKRCRICGRVQDIKSRYDLHEPPDGMQLYEVRDFHELIDIWLKKRSLPEEMRTSND